MVHDCSHSPEGDGEIVCGVPNTHIIAHVRKSRRCQHDILVNEDATNAVNFAFVRSIAEYGEEVDAFAW